MATGNAILKKEGLPTKSIISQPLLILDNKTWYQIKAKTQTFHTMVRYTNYLICILMHINENLKMR